MKTGDILLFEGPDSSVFSRNIKRGQKLAGHEHYQFSHVGMFLESKDFEFLQGYPNVVFESTTMNTAKDVIVGSKISGVSVVAFDERMKGQTVSVRRWEMPSATRRRMIARTQGFVKRMHGVGYENDPGELLKSALPWESLTEEEDLERAFCSELVYAFLECAGIINPTLRKANSQCPAEIAGLSDWGLARNVKILPIEDIKHG